MQLLAQIYAQKCPKHSEKEENMDYFYMGLYSIFRGMFLRKTPASNFQVTFFKLHEITVRKITS